jgi:hypothetical protein
MPDEKKVNVYPRYPISSILIYNGATVLHYVLGTVGIIAGFKVSSAAYVFGYLYFALAFLQMYVLMPRTVCPNCVYYRMEKGRCISALNIFSRKIAPEGKLEDFPNRGKGVFCHNNIYMASFIVPIIALIPALVLNFSAYLLLIFFALVGLMVFRIFVIFPKIACIRCCAKNECPNAKQMGL